VFILTDDQGMGDMDIPGGDFENLMPNIRRLNEAGLNLTFYYSASLCTPARSSLMTGRYPVNARMGHGVVMATMPWGLPLSYKLLPEYLNDLGYTSYHVGKWHLGHYSKSHLPSARGFNSSMGYYGGYQHPQSYFYEWPGCSNSTGCVPDMHYNDEIYEVDGQFNTETFADEAERIIASHTDDPTPFFLYLAPNLIHMPVHPDESIVKSRESDLSSISDSWRRRMGAMAIMLDDFVYRIETAINNAGLMDNTILIYASDNGAQTEGSQMGAGSNYPLRGSKGSLFEGATRVPAFVYSPILGHSMDKTGSSQTSLFHVSDWLPTLIGGALGRSDLLPADLDGIDQWEWMAQTGTVTSAPRTKMIYNIDTATGISAVRVGSWKLLLNESDSVGWYDGDTWGLDMCFNTATNSIQLYNIDDDEEERVNLATQQPDIVSALRTEIDTVTSSAPSPAYCGVFDNAAITLWFEKNQVEPWIELSDSSEVHTCTQRLCPCFNRLLTFLLAIFVLCPCCNI
jgi:arylsulfatase A-like enzyme